MSNQPRLAALALAATALVASSCGSSAKSSSPAASATATQESSTTTSSAASTTTSPSSSSASPAPATLIATADAICKQVNAKREASQYSTASQGTRFTQIAGYERKEAAELGKLTAPASIASDWKLIVSDTQQLSGNIGRLAEYANANRLSQSGQLVAVIGTLEHQMLKTARSHGFVDCAHT